jgi:hypothetical protein
MDPPTFIYDLLSQYIISWFSIKIEVWISNEYSTDGQ